jgi:hypothetical protein
MRFESQSTEEKDITFNCHTHTHTHTKHTKHIQKQRQHIDKMCSQFFIHLNADRSYKLFDEIQ